MKKRVVLLCFFVLIFISLFAGFGCKKGEKGHSRYEIIAEYIPENKTLMGVTKIAFENVTENELSVLKFQLYPNAYRKDALYRPLSNSYTNAAYYMGESYGEMSISSVNGAKNWEIIGEDLNILCVFLEKALFPGEKVVLDIGFITKLANVNHRTGVTEHTVNLGNFYPILCGIQHDGFVETLYYATGDPFFSACADYKITLTVPKDYEVASTGKIIDERVLESKKVYTMYATNVRDFAIILSENYRIASTKSGETILSYYYYADETPLETLAMMKEAFEYYESTFGEYTYETYTIAQTGFCQDGAEYPALAIISDSLKKKGRTRAIAHETAHQWWYGVVGSNQIDEAWQDEGLAEYSALAFFENYEKYGVSREEAVQECLREYRSYYDVYGSVLGRTDTRMSRPLAEYLSDYEYKCLAYDKAVVMLDTLRKSVGDKAFFAALKRYYLANKFKMASSGDLVGSFEKTGLDASGFFDSFLSGKAIL